MTQTKEQKLKHKSLAGVAEFMDNEVRELKRQMEYNKREMRALHDKQFKLKRQMVKMATLANSLRELRK